MPRSRTLANPHLMPDVDTIGYVRVSTEQQTGEHRTSLAEQRREILKRAKELGRILVPAALFEDPGVSGATAEGRPGFMAMLQYCEAHPRPRSAPGVVLVLNDSRFGRFDDPKEALLWQFVLEQRYGWKVRFCEGDDHGEGMGRDVVRLIGSAQASEYRANLKRTALRTSRATAEQGRWQNEAPFGYRRLATRADGSARLLEIGQRKADDEIVKLAPGPAEEQTIVRHCFTQYAAGLATLGALAREMLKRWPARPWVPSRVNGLLKNAVYVGDVVWCRRAHDKAERQGQRLRPEEKWVIVRDAHPALVSRELFDQVQQRLVANKRQTRAAAGGYPLSGFIRCAVCDDRYIGGGGRPGPQDDPDRYRRYIESEAPRAIVGVKKKRCVGPIATLSRRWLDAAVIKEIAAVVTHPSIQKVIAAELDRALANAIGGATDRQLDLKKEKERLGRQRTRLIDAIAAGVLSHDEATPKMAELRAQLEGAQADAERTQFASRRVKGTVELRDRILALATNFPELARRARGPALRELIRPWLADAIFDKRTRVLTLTIRKVPNLLPSQEPGGCPAKRNPMSLTPAARAREPLETNTRRRLVVVRRIDVPVQQQRRPRRRAS